MSALLIGLALAALPTNDELLSKRGTLFETAHHNLKFELFVPSNWQPPSATAKRYPVIVFLHGRGESGGFEINNAQSLPLQLLTNRSFAASFPFITVVPQCPRQCAMANHWLSTTLQSVTALVRDWVLHQPDAGNGGLGGERSKVYLAGQSMGGHGAWIYAAQQPRLFAAIVVVCGYMHGSARQRQSPNDCATIRLRWPSTTALTMSSSRSWPPTKRPRRSRRLAAIGFCPTAKRQSSTTKGSTCSSCDTITHPVRRCPSLRI